MVGANYRFITLNDLEILDNTSNKIREAIFLGDAAGNGIEGCVIISTCNRFEVYVDTETPDISAEYLLNKIYECTGLSKSKIGIHTSSDAIRHLFRVSAGLESMIVGEAEIAGQVKQALREAQIQNQTSRITEALFQRAAEVSKKVSTETGLGTAGRSLITGGLDIVRESGFELRAKRVLVIGTGAYARVVTSALEREGVREIFTYSNSGRAELFAESHGTTPVTQGELRQVLEVCDVIVACSGTHGTTITTEDLRALDKKMLPVIDLSLARDVEKSVASLSNVMVIDLEEIYRRAPAEHHETIVQAEKLIENSVSQFTEDLKARRNDPLIRLLREHIETLVEEEVNRVRRKSGDEIASQVGRSLHAVTKTIFHKPTIAARDTAINNETDEYQRAIRVLFGLKIEPNPDTL